MEEMFCFQCQETMNETACTVQGMCGKSAACANLQDALIRASQYAALYDTASDEQLMNNLFMTITNANFSQRISAGRLKKHIPENLWRS